MYVVAGLCGTGCVWLTRRLTQGERSGAAVGESRVRVAPALARGGGNIITPRCVTTTTKPRTIHIKQRVTQARASRANRNYPHYKRNL